MILPPWAKGDPREFIRVHREVIDIKIPHPLIKLAVRKRLCVLLFDRGKCQRITEGHFQLQSYKLWGLCVCVCVCVCVCFFRLWSVTMSAPICMNGSTWFLVTSSRVLQRWKRSMSSTISSMRARVDIYNINDHLKKQLPSDSSTTLARSQNRFAIHYWKCHELHQWLPVHTWGKLTSYFYYRVTLTPTGLKDIKKKVGSEKNL